MTDTEISELKGQVFGNGQSSTHTPTPQPTNDTLQSAEPKPTEAVAETAPPNGVPTPIATSPSLDDEIVDDDVYLEKQLGVKSWDEAKSALAELAQLREAAKTPAEQKFVNEQSRIAYEALKEGKMDIVYEILDTQKKISGVDSMKPADAIKLHIQQTNKSFKSIDVEDVFEEKYTYPERPVKDDLEDEEDFSRREDKWKAAKEKVDRRIERDAATAKAELSKLSAELKFPEIPKLTVTPQANDGDAEKEMQIEIAKASEFYSKLSPKDVQMVFKFNDEASKLAFDITYEPEKETLDAARVEAADLTKFFDNFYEKDGSPNRTKQLKAIYVAKNIDKIVTEAMVQAVNQERIRALKYQKNIGSGEQRNYIVPPMSEVDTLRQAVFGK